MGIPGLWDILGEGEVMSIAQLSTDHYKRTGRPLRVAIDEAGWRFHNLSDAQVAAIRQKVPEANPIEKAILWRVLKLMRMNIQPIFIFDGPSRPWKRGGTAGKIDWKKIDLLRKTLDHLKIPHHRAPSEAEAECAQLNLLGIVDAVWTDDGDALMFGAKVLIKEHREGGNGSAKKSDTMVRVYRADAIEREHRINRQGLVRFALLSGGDYNTKGLEGCGPKAALKAAQFENGRLGQVLWETPLQQLHTFTESLRTYFQLSGSRNIYVPPDFPRDLHVKNYREPKVATLEQANNLRGLKKGWYVPVDEGKLRPFLRETFNFTTRDYLRHILPILLTKELVQTTPETVSKNLVFGIELVHKRGQDHNQPCLERKVIFNPKVCTEENCWTQPPNEDWKTLETKAHGSFDPTAPVETEFLEYILVGALGEAEMQRLKDAAGQPKTRKRTVREDKEESSQMVQSSVIGPDQNDVPTKKARKTSIKEGIATSTDKAEAAELAKPKATKGPGKEVPPTSQHDPGESAVASPPVRKGFQLPRALIRNPSMLWHLESYTSQDMLSQSASFHSHEKTHPSSGAQASKFVSANASYPAHGSNLASQTASVAPPSSQSLSASAAPPLLLEETPSTTATNASGSTPVPTEPTAAVYDIYRQSQPLPLHTVSSPQTAPLPTSRHIVIDLDSDGEDSPPSLRLTQNQPSIRTTPSNPAEPRAMSDERAQVTAARLKHFASIERHDSGVEAGGQKECETIDLTLDD